MSLREVEEESRTISAKYQKRAYHVSQNALSAYERGASVPSIWKLSTLSEIYGLPYVELLQFYGIELTMLSPASRRRALRLQLERIHRKIANVEEEIRTRSFNWFA
jgi:transcriptional regulator with XRE-family HTH domain